MTFLIPIIVIAVSQANNSSLWRFPSSCCQLGVRKSRKNCPFWGLIIKVKQKMLFMKGNSHWQSNFLSPMRSLGVMLSSSHLWPGRLPRFLSYKSPLASRTRTSDTIEGMIIATYLPTRSVSSSLRRGRRPTLQHRNELYGPPLLTRTIDFTSSRIGSCDQPTAR